MMASTSDVSIAILLEAMMTLIDWTLSGMSSAIFAQMSGWSASLSFD